MEPFFLLFIRSKQALRIGMGCEAQTANNSSAIVRICNDADRPRPQRLTHVHAAVDV